MGLIRKAAIGLGGLAAAWIGWGAYVTRTTKRVPYDALATVDDVEIRRYPQTVLAETTASDPGTAFSRLFRYIEGANTADADVPMTAPVATGQDAVATTASPETLTGAGESVSMTAPVRTAQEPDAVSMAFYLPPEYTPDTAPTPSDPDVRLVVEPPHTVAVYQFSWYATDDRVERAEEHLLERCIRNGVEVTGQPVLLQYNDPWTPPFMRRNEVAVPIEDGWA